ncbi:MAG: glutamate 5-kinase [Deltaproteobacteria bacterium]|nr:MAG: glutamate 5-kinase [Deltaproteobacteria bacterium]
MNKAAETRKSRSALLKGIKRVVIKVGSGVLTTSNDLNLEVIRGLVLQMITLRNKGIEIVLISSGAIAAGLRKMGFNKRPQSVSQQQAIAALGQSRLIMVYEEAFGQHGQQVAQVLLTRDDLTHRRRYLNARNTLFTLLAWNIIPIINENDTVVVDEIKFGDNDNLSAMVTGMTESQLLISLTNIDGFFDRDPRCHEDASLIHVVQQFDRNIMKCASSIPGFLGSGGMASKVKAAQRVSMRGVPTIIANGLKPGILHSIFDGKNEGTLFMPAETRLCNRKHWIAFTKAPRGALVIDKGAERAILKQQRSLLPSGIVRVDGRFSVGNAVLLVNEKGEEIAIGLVNYHSGDIKKIMGLKSGDIENILGFKYDDEVINRDNLVITNDEEGNGLCQLRA